ncbi:hypothetical protein BMS3Bbin02_00097 [bacterium BMS3Bbin02]|nr:hypothetical protein BMS3Bbin02_00097 [bacterium BMS3Bbin02]
MHQSSYDLMRQIVDGLVTEFRIKSGAVILDCGAAIAGTGLQKSYRQLFPDDVHYFGFDAEPGPNVDMLGDIYELQFEKGVDLVISGQMLEHLTFPLLAVQRMKEVLYTDGWMVLIAPWQYGIHRYPIDCWRVLPDGMQFLFEGFEKVETGVQGNDCWGIGQKPAGYKAPWNISRS